MSDFPPFAYAYAVNQLPNPTCYPRSIIICCMQTKLCVSTKWVASEEVGMSANMAQIDDETAAEITEQIESIDNVEGVDIQGGTVAVTDMSNLDLTLENEEEIIETMNEFGFERVDEDYSRMYFTQE